jgi:hypothetical protein
MYKDQDVKSNKELEYANIITYLDSLKEDNIYKKVLLDMCFKEIQGISIEMVDKNDALIQKI